MDAKTADILEMIRHPGSSDPFGTATAVRDILRDTSSPNPDLLAGLRDIKSELRGRNVPGSW